VLERTATITYSHEVEPAPAPLASSDRT
jgi:hypothetical protein